VTSYLREPGTYQVGFKYTGGWHGLSISRVALAKAPADTPGQPAEVWVDEHQGSAAVRNKANIYTMELDQVVPAAKYLIVAQVRGTPRQGRPPQRQGCNGSVWIKGQMPSDWRARIVGAEPLTDEELSAKAARGRNHPAGKPAGP